MQVAVLGFTSSLIQGSSLPSRPVPPPAPKLGTPRSLPPHYTRGTPEGHQRDITVPGTGTGTTVATPARARASLVDPPAYASRVLPRLPAFVDRPGLGAPCSTPRRMDALIMAQTRPLASRAADACRRVLGLGLGQALKVLECIPALMLHKQALKRLKVGEVAGTQGEADTRVVPHATCPPHPGRWLAGRNTLVALTSTPAHVCWTGRASNIRCITVSWPGAEGGVRDK